MQLTSTGIHNGYFDDICFLLRMNFLIAVGFLHRYLTVSWIFDWIHLE